MNVGILIDPSPRVKDFISSRKPEKMNIQFISDDQMDDFPLDDFDALICNKVPYEADSVEKSHEENGIRNEAVQQK